MHEIADLRGTLGFLSHYYEAASGPFRSLSTLPPAEAEQILDDIRQAGKIFASKRPDDYLRNRRIVERQVRQLFVEKGGQPERPSPHYMIVGDCPWLKDWYQDGRELRILLAAFKAETVSLTYGDSYPAMRYADGRPYRARVYTLAELPFLIETYGLPQIWNAEGQYGPERYIEAQVWADEPLLRHLDREEG
jgi:hypothetical protein